MKDRNDALGHLMLDCLNGRGGHEIIERDDGYFDVSAGAPRIYLSSYRNWHPCEKRAMRYVFGRVLDIGCGAGRVLLHLQQKGFDVMGIDVSPLAVEVCKRRGVKNVQVLSIARVNSRLGTFDTMIMFGNNFGLFADFERARLLLKRFRRITSDAGRIIAASGDVYQTDVPEHLAYHQMNRERGRMPGQVRIRVRYKRYVTPWFDYLIVSKDEMKGILDGTGWRVGRFLDSTGSAYI